MGISDASSEMPSSMLHSNGMICLKYSSYAPPSVEVKDLTRELRHLGVSMNRIAAKAHALGFVDEPEYKRNADEVMRLLGDIRQEYAKKGVKLRGDH